MANQLDWVEIKPEGDSSSFDPKWDYLKDKILEGIFVEVKKDVGKHHSNVYTIELKDGSRKTVWGSTVLDDRMKNLITGEEIRLEYLGDKPTDKGNPYHDFKVLHHETQSS
jgi:hypothetical protein